jgi:hypothetical protein
MAKYACPFCNSFAHTSGSIPNPTEWLLISDVEFEKENDSIDHQQLYHKMTHMFKCNECSAIAIFWNGFGESPTWYNVGI